MVVCECILSDDTYRHVQTVQEKLCRDSDYRSRSEAIGLMVKFIVGDLDSIPIDDLIILDDYFFSNPSFFYAFYDDVMLSATFHSSNYSS